MRCQAAGCSKKAKLKISAPSGWVVRWCFKHTLANARGMFRKVVEWNSALYIQKDPDA